MKAKLIKRISALLTLGLLPTVQAGTFTDNFDANRNYLTQGVAGSSYRGMTSGEINPSSIASWDANISAASTLTITNTGGAWRAEGDGPFIWQMVSGDFTNIVQVSDMSQANFNFSGLMVRNPDASSGQSYVSLAIFAEFNIATVYRDTLNNSDSDISFTPAYFVQDDKTTWPKWLWISREGTLITLNVSVNGVDWDPVVQIDRPDLPTDVQVGMFNSTFSANQNFAQFKNFKIEGPNVGTATPPSPASGLSITPAVKSLTVNWAPGAGSAGSVVVVRRENPIIRQPLNGTNYLGDPVFGAGSSLGESNFVAYAGTGNTVTITNVTPSIPYTIAVYAYSGSDVSTAYAVSNAPVATAVPLGNPTGIFVSYGTTNAVATDDTIQAKAFLQFDSGDSVNVTASTTFSSGDQNVATITAAGLASGLTSGTALITASYQTFNASSNLTVIKLPVTDDFSVPKDYLATGIASDPWHGLLLGAGDVPAGGVTAGLGKTLVANAGITKAGRFTVQSTDTGFDAAEDDGFFLYRVIDGDFSIAVQVTSFNNAAYHMPGLMVRAPFEMFSVENSLAIVGFNEFNIGNFVRVVTSGAKAEVAQQTGQSAQPFIMIQRQTNTFTFYQKAHALDPWTLIWTADRPDLAGIPLQVGIVDQIFTANTGTAEFDNLNFVAPPINSPNAPSGPGNLALSSTQSGKVSLNWTAGAGSSGSIVVAHVTTPVTRQPADGSDWSPFATPDFDLRWDLGGSNYVMYAGSGTSVVVSNFPPSQFSFSVYSYSTVGGTNFYNILNPATGSVVPYGIPIIIQQPPDAITRYQGQKVSLSAGASPGTYRWQHDGTDVPDGGRISGATGTTLSINNLIPADGGNYTFIATSAAGSVTSSPPTALTVLVPDKPSELSVLSYGPTAFWRMEEPSGTVANDYVGGYNGTHGGSDVLGVDGPRPIDGFAHFESTNLATLFQGNAYASAITFPPLTPSTETLSALTITAWIKPAALPADRAGVVTFTAPAESGLRLYGGANGLSILWNNSVSHSGMVPPVGAWSFVAMVVSTNGASVYLATNGGWSVFTDSLTRAPISLSGAGWIGSDRNIGGRFFEGAIDEVSVFKGILSPAAITNLFNGVSAPPSVTLSIERVAGGVQLTWPQGTLLEATSLLGPWTTNNATSPYTISNPQGDKFYRVKVQ